MEKVRNRKSSKTKVKIANEEVNKEEKYVESLLEKSLRVTERQEGDGESIPENTECEVNNMTKKEDTLIKENKSKFRIHFEIDLISLSLFLLGLITRMYKLEEPKDIV